MILDTLARENRLSDLWDSDEALREHWFLENHVFDDEKEVDNA